MSALGAERVGVVVIHGVGETDPGWIDSYLVPKMERWLAYQSIGQATPKDKIPELHVVVPAEDRNIAIAIGDDQSFKALCSVLAPELAEDKAFATPALRLANRDRLQHSIAQILDIKPARDWLKDFQQVNVASALAFSRESAVYRVRDPADSDPTATWTSFTRAWPLEGREVLLTELHWGDMSKVGTTNASRFFAVVQLLLEAPYVLGQAILKGNTSGVHALVRYLTLWSNWIMRWPIAGLNVAVFATSFVVMALQGFIEPAMYLPAVAASLAVVMIGGFIAFRKWVHRKLALADLALAASMFAAILLAILGVAYPRAAPETLTSPAPYLAIGAGLILLSWIVWTVLNVGAILLLALLAAKRLFVRRDPANPPLARPAAAVGLNVLLGIIWKFVLGLFGVLIIRTLVADDPTPSPQCVAATSPPFDGFLAVSNECRLGFTKNILIEVVGLNTISLVLIVLSVLLVIATRRGLMAVFAKRAAEGQLSLPRLIASPLIIVTLFTVALINAAMLLVPQVRSLAIPIALGNFVRDYSLLSMGTGALGLVVFYFLLSSIIERSNSAVHIGRDLVDHQYDPDPRSLAIRASAMGVTAALTSPADPSSRFRRRQRIQRRLEALIDEVIAAQKVNRLIFFAHSQGSVILHDYLLNHDNLIHPAHEAVKTPLDVERIDVLTIGSPLKHIYRYYFAQYDDLQTDHSKASLLFTKLKSWTNMWRIDDPIGQDVDLVAGIENLGIGPGGHRDYWKEDQVCAKLWALIANEPGAKAQPAGVAGR